MPDNGQPADGFTRVRAFTIHVFTATGAGLAFLALVFATGGHWAAMFFTFGVALIVDAIDGPLARTFNIKEVLPRWSGATLDLVIDYTTYVFVPAYAIAASGLMPDALALVAGVVVCMTGALYFADGKMKTADNYFRGFPGLWNLAAFYLYLLEPPEWAAAVGVLVLAVLSFTPVKFLHPFRVTHWRPLNIALLTVWGVLAFLAVAANLTPGPYITVPLCVIAVYFFAVGLLRTRA